MTKVVFLPLDERPCNYDYPQRLAAMTDFELVLPGRELLGWKKRPAPASAVRNWLLREAATADHLIVSIDMLVYGGIVPSRLHHLQEHEWKERLELLAVIRKQRPLLSISAFNLIMRAPAYSNSEEEPDYYDQYGASLFQYGWLTDKAERGGLTADEVSRLEAVKTALPAHVLADFLQRREVNAAVNRAAVELVEAGVIDFLIVPLDDNAKYGYTAKEQRVLTFRIEERNLFDRVHVYPGADEIGCTLLARTFARSKGYVPRLYARYSSTWGPLIIPKYEDRSLHESVKAHITAAGAVLCDEAAGADVQLLIHSPAVGESEVAGQIPYRDRHRSYFTEVNIREFASALEDRLRRGKFVALADVAVTNGSDATLMKHLAKLGLLDRLHVYGGWNTSGNTMGTVVAHAVIASYYFGDDAKWESVSRHSRLFLASRLVEDWGYQALVRQTACSDVLPRYGAEYFNLNGAQQPIEQAIGERLRAFVTTELRWDGLELSHVHLPWNRMFEVGFALRWSDNNG